MAKISVITPTNSNDWYFSARKSMMRQTEKDWEWIVLVNGDFKDNFFENDLRIKIIRSTSGSTKVGALKAEACSHVTTPYAVEFDHDDELHIDCLKLVLKAFETTDAVFVYSDDAIVNKDGSAKVYGSYYGWKTYEDEFIGEKSEILTAHVRPALIPQNVSRIIHAPDHVRAWTMDAYRAVGGHDSSLSVCDDLDLMQKLWIFSGARFHHIPKILYKYIVHGENTWLKRNAEIQVLWNQMHDLKIHEMATAYCESRGTPYFSLEKNINDLSAIEEAGGKWPYDDNSVGLITSNGGLEMLKKPIHIFNEAYRVLKHGGLFLIDVPYSGGEGAFHPANKSQWALSSFWYYTKSSNQSFIKHLGINCRFQEIKLGIYFPSDWHKKNNVSYVRAHLAAIKEGERLHGAYEI